MRTKCYLVDLKRRVATSISRNNSAETVDAECVMVLPCEIRTECTYSYRYVSTMS